MCHNLAKIPVLKKLTKIWLAGFIFLEVTSALHFRDGSLDLAPLLCHAAFSGFHPGQL